MEESNELMKLTADGSARSYLLFSSRSYAERGNENWRLLFLGNDAIWGMTEDCQSSVIPQIASLPKIWNLLDYDLYVAVTLPPAGSQFITFHDSKEFASLDQPEKWGPRMPNSSITILDLTLPNNLGLGQYCLYGILLPVN